MPIGMALAPARPWERQVVTAQVVTASAGSAAFELPNDVTDLRIVIAVTAASGTTPTLDPVLQFTPDDGVTWFYSGNKWLQMTAASSRQVLLQRSMHAAQAAAESSSDNPAAGAAAAAVNGPLSRKARIFFIVGGTTPSFTINVFLIGNRAVGA